MDNGYVKLHRKLFSNELWLSEKFTKAQAWIDLFANANHKDGSFWVRGNEVKIKRGQIGWSELTMCQRWCWSKNKVRRYLKWLETKQQIEQQKTYITTIITIKNYDMYQDTEQQTIQRKDSRRYTNNNAKNDKNDNISDDTSRNIQSFINLFKSINPTYERLFGNKTERLSAERLVKKFGLQKMEAMFVQLPDILSQPYAPRITTPYELEKNLGKLIQFIEQNKNKTIINKPKIAFT